MFALCEHDTKKCLSKYAVRSFDEVVARFEKLIKKIEPLGPFSFACVSPYNPDNDLFVKRQPTILNNDGSIAIDGNYPFAHEDFCVLMQPITNRENSDFSIRNYFPYPHFFQFSISGNIPFEQECQICDRINSIIKQHDYPRTHLIRKAWQKFSLWQRELIIGGVAIVGLGALAYYSAPRIKQFYEFFNYKQLSLGQ